MNISLPVQEFNTRLRDGVVGQKMAQIIEAMKPEAIYFTDHNGQRGAVAIVEVADASRVPALAEPWFLAFNAKIEFHIAMTPEDLKRADLDSLQKKWG